MLETVKKLHKHMYILLQANDEFNSHKLKLSQFMRQKVSSIDYTYIYILNFKKTVYKYSQTNITENFEYIYDLLKN